jgi:nitrite reductase/ring-hydroxylating ferredoxin subunit
MMSDWVRVADESDIADGEPFASEVHGIAIALYRYQGEVFAIGDICTHDHVRLSEGWLQEGLIECPLHQSCFDIRTGKVIEGGPAKEDVAAFAVKVEDGGVFVRQNG